MTMFNDEFNRIFKQMSSSFGNLDDVFEMLQNSSGQSGPLYFGYTMTVGPDGKPVIQEYGNVKPDTFKSTEMSSQTLYLQSILVDVPTTPKSQLPKKENL